MTENGFAPTRVVAQSAVEKTELPRGAEKRKTRRYAVDDPALVIIGTRALACRLCDISFGGAMLEGDLPLLIEEQFRLMLLDLPELHCRVVHVGNGYVGVSFLNGNKLHHDLGEWIRNRCMTQ